ncbi:MAG TPA: MGMT family protein, partial [Kofleriaceae bacterium]|nr:MGMT family protein [Kofleriaceae bacterium]
IDGGTVKTSRSPRSRSPARGPRRLVLAPVPARGRAARGGDDDEQDDAAPGARLARLYAAIYTVARRIPRGRIATYGQVAELAGFPGGSRVAGAAMKANTPADRVPWQRVVGKRGRRGQIAIHDPVGAAVQRQLLLDEGVDVSERGAIELDRFGWLPGDLRRLRARSRPR